LSVRSLCTLPSATAALREAAPLGGEKASALGVNVVYKLEVGASGVFLNVSYSCSTFLLAVDGEAGT